MNRLDTFFRAVVLVMAAHEAEHVAQVVQKDALANACPTDCRGLLGFAFDLEWVHAAYNHSLLLALGVLYVVARMWQRRWRERDLAGWALVTGGVFLVQGYHVVEHTVKLDQWFANGRVSPTPGLLGQVFPLVELHFTINTVVFACVLAGVLRLGLLGRAARVATAAVAALLVLPLPVAWALRTPTTTLAAGVHRGPLVLDERQKLVGEPGAVVVGGIRITADDVSVRGVTVAGGEHGIEIDDAKRVRLTDVRVVGARLDGINARGSSVAVLGCVVHSLVGPMAQGIDISFALHQAPSSVERCTVIGGAEGIVMHFASADVRRNRVTGTSLRAITMTEMSMGGVVENEVEGAVGVAIFCGDYSHCDIRRNTIVGTRADEGGTRTRAGYAIQAHFGASAIVAENRLRGNARGAAAFFNAELRRSSA